MFKCLLYKLNSGNISRKEIYLEEYTIDANRKVIKLFRQGIANKSVTFVNKRENFAN